MQRLRVEPYSSYLERRRKGRSIQSPSPAVLYSCPACHRSSPAPARSNVCRSSAKPRSSSCKCRNVSKPPGRRSRRCSSAMFIARPNPRTSQSFNAVYARYFPSESPARIFLHVPSVHRPVRHRSRLRGGGLVESAVGKFDRQSRRLSPHFSTTNPINSQRDQNQDEKQKYIWQLQ